ncbi:MAG: hypothetical protein JNJ75_03635 [Cyclobacteriaceae bacterium]|nr:hypothetical protein [Cyclobacteriaceae bacterium]
MLFELNQEGLELQIKVDLTGDPRDLTRWHKIVEIANKLDLPDDEKQKIATAITSISHCLGKGFLREAARTNHFLFQRLRNRNLKTFKWAVWFADALASLANNDKDGKTLRKLKSKNSGHEGFEFLMLNHFLTNAGFQILFEQRIAGRNSSKFPDFLLTNVANGCQLYLEISYLNVGDDNDYEKNQYGRIHKALSKNTTQNQIDFCGKIGNLTESEEAELLEQISVAKEKVKADQAFAAIELPNAVIALSHWKSRDEIIAWANERQMPVNSFSGAEVDFNYEIVRMRRKIERKTEQLSNVHQNVIVIEVSHLFMLGTNKIDLMRMVTSYIQQFPRLFGVLIYGVNPFGNKEDSFAEIEGHLFSTLCIDGFESRNFFFFKNEKSLDIDLNTQDMFYSAFRFGKAFKSEDKTEEL